jgi:hypothetical protein
MSLTRLALSAIKISQPSEDDSNLPVSLKECNYTHFRKHFYFSFLIDFDLNVNRSLVKGSLQMCKRLSFRNSLYNGKVKMA